MQYSKKILDAAHQAAEWHVEQGRKGAAKEPYVNHLLQVAALVPSAGASEDVICAVLLHDVIEDRSVAAGDSIQNSRLLLGLGATNAHDHRPKMSTHWGQSWRAA